MLKTCSRCRLEKPVEDFYPRKDRGTVSCYCKPCWAKRHQEHYAQNKSYYVEKAARARAQLNHELDRLKNKPCQDCGSNFPSYVMDFDHRDGRAKVDNIARMRSSKGRRAILAEIAKCDLVCANCHRIRTYNRMVAVT